MNTRAARRLLFPLRKSRDDIERIVNGLEAILNQATVNASSRYFKVAIVDLTLEAIEHIESVMERIKNLESVLEE